MQQLNKKGGKYHLLVMASHWQIQRIPDAARRKKGPQTPSCKSRRQRRNSEDQRVQDGKTLQMWSSTEETAEGAWIKKKVMKEVCRGGGTVSMGMGLGEAAFVRQSRSQWASSASRCCCCHSQQPPGPHVLHITGRAQIMPASTSVRHTCTAKCSLTSHWRREMLTHGFRIKPQRGNFYFKNREKSFFFPMKHNVLYYCHIFLQMHHFHFEKMNFHLLFFAN